MATNSDKGYRHGSVDNRTQGKNPINNYTKRDADSRRFMQQKEGSKPFKDVAREVDHRRK